MTARTAWLRDRLTHRVNGTIQRRVQKDGVDVPAREWDTLVVLDACRHDLFETLAATHESGLPLDDYQTVMSRGSSTDEWLQRNWTNTYPETVYVAGNPLVSRHTPDRFHHLDAVWQRAWSSDDGTITAPRVTDSAIRMHDSYPDKRVVVHYLQPHAPLLRADGDGFEGWQAFHEIGIDGSGDYKNIWAAVSDGAIPEHEVWERYQATLRYVLQEVQRLLDEIDGRVVITSDHGNLLGERGWPLPLKQYGHPPGLRQTPVRRVPWGVREGERREVVAGGVSRSPVDGPDREQLDALGYV